MIRAVHETGDADEMIHRMKTKDSSLTVVSAIILACFSTLFASQAGAAPKRVLVVTTTTGFRHSSIDHNAQLQRPSGGHGALGRSQCYDGIGRR